MPVWNVLNAARWKCRTQKIAKNLPSAHRHTTLSSYIFATKSCIDNRKKNLLNSNISLTCPYSMVNLGILVAETDWRVLGTRANFNRFRVLAALLHGNLIVGIRQTLRHWTEGATYIRQGGQPFWISQEQEMMGVAVVSAGPYANHLHLTPDNHASTSPLFLQAGCHFCHPTKSVKALKALVCIN